MNKPTDQPWVRSRIDHLTAIAAELPGIETTIDEYPGHGYPPALHFPQYADKPWSFHVAAAIDSDNEIEPEGDIVAVGTDEFIPLDLADAAATAAKIRAFIAAHQE